MIDKGDDVKRESKRFDDLIILGILQPSYVETVRYPFLYLHLHNGVLNLIDARRSHRQAT
jgi:hypothetical protein